MTSKVIHKYGGDIVQFLGSSLIAVWNYNQEVNDGEHDHDEDQKD
jgi:hypothetical protein